MSDRALANELLRQAVIQLRERSLPRIETCLDLLDEDELWRQAGPSTVAIGNLLLHLAGNVRQWIIGALGGVVDERDRPAEFSRRGGSDKGDLLQNLRATLAEAEAVLANLDADRLLAVHEVQGMKDTGVGIVIHVVEHFSYHVGQIAWWTKVMKERDLGFYAGVDLEAKNGDRRR